MPCVVTSFVLHFSFSHVVAYAVFMYVVYIYMFSFSTLPRIK